MIDVIEHIVDDSQFDFAMENEKNPLSAGGVFILVPVMEFRKKPPFFLRFWLSEDIRNKFSGYCFDDLVPFRNCRLLTIGEAQIFPMI
jgi:hypothetical protein